MHSIFACTQKTKQKLLIQLHQLMIFITITPLCCELSRVQPCSVVTRTAGTAHYLSGWVHLHLPHTIFAIYARKSTVQLPVSWVFPTERRCMTTFITLGTRVGLSDRKHSLIQVSGVWVKESSLSVYVHQSTGVVSTLDNMLTHQQAHFQVTSPHMKGNMSSSWQAVPEGMMLWKILYMTCTECQNYIWHACKCNSSPTSVLLLIILVIIYKLIQALRFVEAWQIK